MGKGQLCCGRFYGDARRGKGVGGDVGVRRLDRGMGGWRRGYERGTGAEWSGGLNGVRVDEGRGGARCWLGEYIAEAGGIQRGTIMVRIGGGKDGADEGEEKG